MASGAPRGASSTGRMHKSSVYLPEALKARLAALARRSGRSEAQLLRLAVERLVAAEPPGRPAAGTARRHDPVVERHRTGPGLVGVGVGPGDPGLLTLRALRALRAADRVLAPTTSLSAVGRAEAIVRDAAPDLAVERLAFVMVADGPARDQALDRAADRVVGALDAGERVAFVTLGDPMVFGRGGEEAASLRAAGVPHRVVPGVTSAIAAPAAAGIPVTLRGVSAAFTVVSGHEAPEGSGGVAWEALGRLGGTIVVLMATATIGRIAERLSSGGLAPDTPVAAVTDGTLPEQGVWRGTLAEVADAGVRPPATFVIGAVAGVAVVGPAGGTDGGSA